MSEGAPRLLASAEEAGTTDRLGPVDPHVGGALLLRVPDAAPGDTLDRIRDQDPFTRQKLAQYELLLWNVKTGIEDLDGIRR